MKYKIDDHTSPPHPFFVTYLPSRFQALFIINAKYSSSSIDIDTLL
jgi:hypothetical protein